MARIFTDTLQNSNAIPLLSHTADSGQAYSAIVISAVTIEPGLLTINTTGVPQATPTVANAGGALIGSGFTLPGTGHTSPGTFTILSQFTMGAGLDSGGGWIFNYDATAHTGLIVNLEPLTSTITLYSFSYVTGTEFAFTKIGSSQSFTFALNTTYLLLIRYVAGVLTVNFGGVACTNLNYTDVYSTGNLCALRMSAYTNAVNNCIMSNFQIYNTALNANFYSDNANVKYIGNGEVQGSGSSSYRLALASGDKAIMNLSGTEGCILNYNVSNVGAYYLPDLVYRIDGLETRLTLPATGQVVIAFPTWSGVNTSTYLQHKLEVILEGANGSTGPAGLLGSTGWTNSQGCAFFAGITIETGGSLLPVTVPSAYIEFDGDSIVAAENMLGSGSSYPPHIAAHIGWAYQVGEALGLAPVVRGFEGNGLVKTSDGGGTTTYQAVPLANLCFPFVAAGVSYVPNTVPAVVVTAYGTNDEAQSVPTATWQAALQTYLTTIRAAYPKALIVNVVLPSASTYAAVAAAAITALADANMTNLNYSALSYTTTDGVHPDVGGAVTIAAQMAADILTFINARGLKLQIATGGGGGNFAGSG